MVSDMSHGLVFFNTKKGEATPHRKIV